MRDLLAKIILRGRLLAFWMRRKGARFSFIYTRALLDSSARLLQRGPVPEALPKKRLSKADPAQILYIGDILWENYYLMPELERICPVHVLNLRGTFESEPPEKQSEKIAHQVAQKLGEVPALAPSVVLVYLPPHFLSQELFDLLRRRFSCPIVGMNLDDQGQFLDYPIYRRAGFNYQEWAKQFDVNLTSGKKIIDWYRSRDLPVYYMAQGIRRFEGLTMPESVADFRYGMSFLGAAKGERRELIDEIRRRGVEVACFGSGWPGSAWVDDPNVVFRGSMLNLGIGVSVPLSRLTHIKGRDFECPGVGGCYLTTYNWELTDHYEIGKEILCYSTFEELIEIYSYYRTRPEECLKIGQAAWRRCQADHTWEKRFRDFFRWLS